MRLEKEKEKDKTFGMNLTFTPKKRYNFCSKKLTEKNEKNNAEK